MKENFKRALSRHFRILLHTLLTIASIGLIIYFMPRNNVFSYNYSESSPWNYGDIIATFDFPIYKSEAQLGREKDSIKEHFVHYFTKDSTVAANSLRKLKNRFYINESEEIPKEAYIRYYNALISLYNKGIVTAATQSELSRNKAEAIHLISGNISVFANKQDLITPEQAYSRLLMADTFPRHIIDSYGIRNLIEPNIIPDTARTRKLLEEEIAALPLSEGIVQNGQKIVSRGEKISAETYKILKSYQHEMDSRQGDNYKTRTMLLGQVLFALILFGILIAYIYIYNPDIRESNNKFILVISSVVIFPVIVGAMMQARFGNVFMLPFALTPMILCLFTSPRTAITAHTINILLCSIMLNSHYEFVLLQIAAGFATILSLKELSSRSQMFRSAFIVLLTYCATFLSYELIVENDITRMNFAMYIYFAISSALILFAYPLLFIIEKLLGFVSSITLIELSNLNHPLLQKISQEAPSTFQHSMQVGNLAAEAARNIGANSLEVRTGALYHDIGKTANPIYFTENQSGGINPHDSLQPQESARIIIKHVIDGLAIAEHNHLPRKIKDFIATHHGVSKAGFFYKNYKDAHPDEEIDESIFTYPGPAPTTKEQGILMLADSVEAASHSIKEFTAANIDKKVDDVVDGKVNSGELRECPLNFREIYIIKEVFKKRLKAIYHTRISYPESKN